MSSSECPFNLACINEKCRDPCPNSCGLNSECKVVSHTPNCICLTGYTGDPFSQCILQPQPVVVEVSTPCTPSPCGANAICREQNGAGSCSCLPDYIGNPYEGCRPECTINSDCPTNRACIRNKCQDPCPGTCGPNALCQVINHLPTCTCIESYTGNPFSVCTVIIETITEKPRNPCFPSPCGPNSQCRVNNEQAVCTCLPNYVGSPPGCRPECVVNSECPREKACIQQKCSDPCPGVCGFNANCVVINHSPICSCKESFTGDPFTRCIPLPSKSTSSEFSPPQIFVSALPQLPIVKQNPCFPSPCGPNSQCREVGDLPSCSCLPNYIGSPPSCRPECSVNSDCVSSLACIREKCQDPCPGSCGISAQCSVINHIPICNCLEGYTGDPFVQCNIAPVQRKISSAVLKLSCS